MIISRTPVPHLVLRRRHRLSGLVSASTAARCWRPRSTSTATSPAATCRRSSSTGSAIVYSKIENCSDVDEIEHPAVREVLALPASRARPRDPPRRRPAGPQRHGLELRVHRRPAARAARARGRACPEQAQLATRGDPHRAGRASARPSARRTRCWPPTAASTGSSSIAERRDSRCAPVICRTSASSELAVAPDAVLHRHRAHRLGGRRRADRRTSTSASAQLHAMRADGRRGARASCSGDAPDRRVRPSSCTRRWTIKRELVRQASRPRTSTRSTTRRAGAGAHRRQAARRRRRRLHAALRRARAAQPAVRAALQGAGRGRLPHGQPRQPRRGLRAERPQRRLNRPFRKSSPMPAEFRGPARLPAALPAT